MTKDLIFAVYDVIDQCSGPVGSVAKDGGRRLAITFDVRYKAQAFALILKEELTKRKIAGTVRRVNRYQVDVA